MESTIGNIVVEYEDDHAEAFEELRKDAKESGSRDAYVMKEDLEWKARIKGHETTFITEIKNNRRIRIRTKF